ncbi:response regulator [Qipengyuania sp. JC766]|uniref:response regulator n=1 Tax=Qipengyuania sp. JC766 TaxID=3232139 RepID=UPI003459B9DC
MFEGKRILILEDEPIIAFDLEDLLMAENAKVAVAGSVDGAFASLEKQTFDFAVLDVNLHGTKSYPFASRLVDEGVPFLFATGYGDAEHPAEFAHVPTIMKPYRLSQIKDAASRTLLGKRS